MDEHSFHRARRGDHAAFATLVASYEKLVYNIAYRFFCHAADAEDICQTVFLKVYQKLPEFRDYKGLKAWICAIASNACIDESRRRKGRQTESLYLDLGDEGEMERPIPAADPSPEEALLEKEGVAAVEEAIARLPEEFRLCLVLRDLQQLSYEEVAAALGVSLGTVKSRLARGRERVRRMLEE